MSTNVKKWFDAFEASRKERKEELDLDVVRELATKQGFAYVTVSSDLVSQGIVHAISRVGYGNFVHGPGPSDFLFETDSEAIMFKLTLA
jgi:hypothetical protein